MMVYLMRKQMWYVKYIKNDEVRYMLFLFQWSYGVVCWEIFSVGIMPYPGLSSGEVAELLNKGERLSRPRNAVCSQEM